MPYPFVVPAGMIAVRIAGKWILKKLAQRSKKKERKRERKRRGKEKEEKKKEARRYQKNLETPASKLKKRDVKKKLKELKGRQKARREKTEKDLEGSDSRPSPSITRLEAVARATAKKEALVQRRKAAENIVNPIWNKAIAKLHKDFPQTIGGMGNSYGHGKGIGKKIQRIMGTDKKSIERNRQYKRENEQVSKQRRQKIKNEKLSKRKRTRHLTEDAKRRRN